MVDTLFYAPFNSFSVISEQWADDNEGLCAMGPRIRLRRFRLEQGSKLGLLDQLVRTKPTGLPVLHI